LSPDVKFIFGNKANPKLNEDLCEYVSQRIWGKKNDFGPCGSIGVISGEHVLGAAVFHNWQEDDGVIEISAAADSPRWLGRKTIHEIMGICFKQHGCQQIVSRMAIDNERAIRIYEFLGFTKIILPNMRGRGKDEYLMLLTDEMWAAHKLNEVDHGQKTAKST
jgi:RimJ/RimL family protein N-acetyltransferase